QSLPRPHPALEAREFYDLAVVASRFTQSPAQVDNGAAPRARTPVAQPLRQPSRGLASQTAQRFARIGWAKAPFDERFGARRGLTGLVRFFGGDRLVDAPPVFLGAEDVLLFTLR